MDHHYRDSSGTHYNTGKDLMPLVIGLAAVIDLLMDLCKAFKANSEMGKHWILC